MRSCIFSIITPVFSVTWSSEIIIICCSRNISFWLLSMSKTVVLTIFLCKLWYILFFRIYRWIESSTEQCLFEISCNIINIFTVTLDQFNASLLDKSINLFLPPKVWMVVYHGYQNIWHGTRVFNTDNNNKKHFLSSKSFHNITVFTILLV